MAAKEEKKEENKKKEISKESQLKCFISSWLILNCSLYRSYWEFVKKEMNRMKIEQEQQRKNKLLEKGYVEITLKPLGNNKYMYCDPVTSYLTVFKQDESGEFVPCERSDFDSKNESYDKNNNK